MIRMMLALAAMMTLTVLLSGCDSEPTPDQAPEGTPPAPVVEVPMGPGVTPGGGGN